MSKDPRQARGWAELSPMTLEALTKAHLGKGRFSGSILSDVGLILLSQASWPDDVPRSQRLSLVHKGIAHVGNGQNPFSNSDLEKAIHREIGQYRELPLQQFQVATTLALAARHFRRGLRRTCRGSRISIRTAWPKSVGQARAPNKLGLAPNHVEPDGYSRVIIHVSARTASDAVHIGLESFALLRGIWAHSRLNGTRRMVMGAYWIPPSPFRLGTVHTVHWSDGRPAHDHHWIETEFTLSHSLGDELMGLDRIWRREASTRTALKRCRPSLRGELEAAFIRYADACDSPSPGVAFLRLWGLLEHLTASDPNRSDRTLERAAFIFAEHHLARDILYHLREQRNRYVHADAADHPITEFAEQLRGIVDALLDVHLFLGGYMGSLQEIGEFLSLPATHESRKRRVRLLRLADRFKGEGPSAHGRKQ